MDKNDVVKMLEEIQILLEVKGENHFKTKAYEKAARIIEGIDENIKNIVNEKRLSTIPGIGKALEQKIEEYVNNGRLEYLETLKAEFPEGLFELLKIPGLGPKKLRVLYKELGITNLGELEYACLENRLIKLDGFGQKTQKNILTGIENLNKFRGKNLYSEALSIGEMIIDNMTICPHIIDISIAGSLRRCKEIIKDIDIIASSEEREEVMDYFASLPVIETVVSKGVTKSSVLLKTGINVDLRVVSPKEYPYALHHFTGSKEHNTTIRHIAKGMGIKMNEYGLFREGDKLIECNTERDIFSVLGMEYIPPELRENRGEIEKAIANALPELVSTKDLKGIFHIHSNYSDGIDGIENIVKKAQEIGFNYIGISDHSKSAFYARGLKEDDVLNQWKEIDIVNEKYPQIKIFKGIESDITKEGDLDYPENILKSFDFVIASIHSNFNLNKEEMTNRIVKAMENKFTTILGHPTGRLLLSRDEYKIDLEKIIKVAAKRGTIIEINASPYRLDLDWRWVKFAKEQGVKMAICPDAHNAEELNNYKYGIGIARKGWLTKGDVVNCMGTKDLTLLFNKIKNG